MSTQLHIPNDAILTYSGRVVRPLDPHPDTIDIEDIAHALSNQCRFTGHTREFYSVAQHSVHCSEIAPREFQLEALLHDASEAYLSDIARPVKKTLGFGEFYLRAEELLDCRIRQHFGLPRRMSAEVKLVDNMMLQTEGDQLMPWSFPDYGNGKADIKIRCWNPKTSRVLFLERYEELA